MYSYVQQQNTRYTVITKKGQSLGSPGQAKSENPSRPKAKPSHSLVNQDNSNQIKVTKQ